MPFQYKYVFCTQNNVTETMQPWIFFMNNGSILYYKGNIKNEILLFIVCFSFETKAI